MCSAYCEGPSLESHSCGQCVCGGCLSTGESPMLPEPIGVDRSQQDNHLVGVIASMTLLHPLQL